MSAELLFKLAADLFEKYDDKKSLIENLIKDNAFIDHIANHVIREKQHFYLVVIDMVPEHHSKSPNLMGLVMTIIKAFKETFPGTNAQVKPSEKPSVLEIHIIVPR